MDSSKHSVAILDDYQGVALTSTDWSSVLNQVEIDVFRDTLSDENALVERLRPYYVQCFIATTGTRNRGIDVEYAQEKGISVSGTGSGGNSTVEHIWALIMAVARDIVKEHNNIRNRNPQWQTSVAVGLQNKTLGLIGLGRLGSEIAKIAKVFGMRTIGWSPHLTSERAATAGVEFIASKEELLKESDIISIHMVLSESTKGLIGPDDFKRMKPSALLINTSRGPLVNEEALIEALRSGKIASAGLDVFDQEPLPLDHPLRRQENVTLSPHNGYVSDTNYETFWGETVENIRAYLDGKPQRLL